MRRFHSKSYDSNQFKNIMFEQIFQKYKSMDNLCHKSCSRDNKASKANNKKDLCNIMTNYEVTAGLSKKSNPKESFKRKPAILINNLKTPEDSSITIDVQTSLEQNL